ncbi:hypothetical protein ACFWXK_22670 [Streptomyces sp. NPDC059070]|uniref:hypothetical protein n=1 Tax=Streptomyces sp. NPDC059070 TaxID=3346713 RepID=UPI0036873F4F
MSETIECRATRLGGTWVAHLREYGVYGHGRTLAAVRDDTRKALTLIGVDAQVTVTPVSPELEALHAARQAYTNALAQAVGSLAGGNVTPGDISTATREPPRRVREILREQPAA